ncbi:hypothetical protein CM15mP5_1830 [bacterium]|nr:MAG: hypothetical protein CM15mP5_1830 [bacterium]
MGNENVSGLSILKRFFEIEYGQKFDQSELYLKLQECLEKINEDGMSVLNDFSFFHGFVNDGIRSQKVNDRFYFGLIFLQILITLILIYAGVIFGIFNIILIFVLILVENLLFWIISATKRQSIFLNKIRKWSMGFYSDIDLANFLSIESLQNFLTTEPFDEKKYAKLWLKEMSTSMDHDWQDIILELHPNEDQLIPNIRVTLGGVRKTMQPASEYGFSNIENSSPNILLITCYFFLGKKIRFLVWIMKRKHSKRIDQLNNHFELLFGKRKQKPIEYDDEQECWETIIKIVDRSSTARNDIRQSLDVFGKIINSYVGYDAV